MTTETTFQNVNAFVNPLFAFGRTMVDEAHRQAERWNEYGAAQIAEAQRVAKALREQGAAMQRSTIEAMEKATASAIESAATWSKAFARSAA